MTKLTKKYKYGDRGGSSGIDDVVEEPKLTKAQEKRFDERWSEHDWVKHRVFPSDIKQHLAKELSLQKKEMKKKILVEKEFVKKAYKGKKPISDFGFDPKSYIQGLDWLDQAIKSIKEYD